MKLNEKRESFPAYETRLRSAALAIPNGIPEDVLMNRLKAGIPLRLREQAHLVTGTYDEVATRLGRLSTAQVIRETVQEMSEDTPRSVLGVEDNRYATYLCHFCGNRRHIARDCVKKKTKGKGTRALSAARKADTTQR